MYNQQPQRIEVIVRKEGGNGEKNNRETDTENAGGSSRSGSVGQSRQNKRFAVVNATHTFAVVKQLANAEIQYQLTGLGLTHGDEAYQQQVGRRVEIMEDGLGFASSVAMGASFGAIGGLPGAITGMALGAARWSISHVYKYKTRGRDYDFKMFKENNAIEYKRARAQINLTTGRLR